MTVRERSPASRYSVGALGGAFMPEYRLHFLNRKGGDFAHSYPFPAASDADAIAFA